jgi:DHA2 family multidrug resistance protein
MSAVRQFAQRLVWNRSPTPAIAAPQALCHPDDRAAHAPPAISARPLIGVLAVLIGAIISTLDSRITSFGLADVRGAVHAGFDEGAWITTAFTVGQMMIGPISAWLGGVFGPRRVLTISVVVFGISNSLLPLSANLGYVFAFQAISGLASGTFIPLAIGFVVQNLPAQMVIYGVAAYSLNLELSLNIAASIEGWFDDYWSWKWIFWDTALLSPLMLICIVVGMPRQPINRALLKTADWAGMLYASVGFSVLYAGLDQGNRLDWLNSGLITALLLGGTLLLVVFVIHELTYKRPWINLRFAAHGNMPLLLLFISFFRFVILSTSYIIPQYLTTVQNYRAIEIGGALKWVALPQFLSAPAVATILRFVDARLMMALGFTLVGCACFMAGQLTHDWVSEDFLPSQLLQAVGQSFGLTSLVWFSLKHLEPSEIFTFGAVLQNRAAVRCAAWLGLRPDIRSRARADLFQSHRPARRCRLAADISAAAGLCENRRRPLYRRPRSRGAGDCSAGARRAESSLRARLHRRLYGAWLCRHRRALADVVAARPARPS